MAGSILVALVGLPLGGGALLIAAGRPADRLAPVVGVVLSAAVTALAVAAALRRPAGSAPLLAGIRAGLAVDGLSAVLVVVVAAVSFAVLCFSAAQLGGGQARARFTGLMLLFAGAMLVTVTATGLAVLLMAWEVMGATSYALIGFWWTEPRRLRAANTAFLTTRAADLGLYLAAGAALGGGVPALTLVDLPAVDPPWLGLVTAGIVVSALGKSAQLPFSFWLSRAMEGPSPVSALLHSAAMVAAGAYLLLRAHPLLAASGWAEPTVAWVGALTALLLGLVAVAQRDLKQVLAASTSAQVGFMVLAAGAGGVAGGTAQLVAHAATKALLFLAAGAWLTALGTKRLATLRGAARRYRQVGAAFTVGAFALAGLPPASLWASKDELLAAAADRGPALYTVGLAAAVVSAVYSARMLWYVWQPVPADAASGYDTERRGTRRVPPGMTVPLVGLAVFAGGLGVLALPAVAEAGRRLLGAGGEPSPRWWQLVLSAGLALLAAAATWRWGASGWPVPASLRHPLGGRIGGWLGGWLGLERGAHRFLVRPVLAFAGLLAAFDDRVLDRGVCGAARACLRLATAAARFDDGVVDAAVRGAARGGLAAARAAGGLDDGGVDRLVSAVAAAGRRSGRWARLPQTGLLHQYYAQAVAAFTLLAVLVIVVR